MTLTGCSGREVSDRILADRVAMSYNDGEYSLSVRLCSSDEEDGEVISGSGRSLYEAVAGVSEGGGGELFLGRCEVLTADESILTDTDILRMLPGAGVSIGCRVYYSEEPHDSIAISSQQINGAYSMAEKRGESADCCLKDLTESIALGLAAAVPVLKEGRPGGIALVTSVPDIFLMSTEETKIYNILTDSPAEIDLSGIAFRIEPDGKYIMTEESFDGTDCTVTITGKAYIAEYENSSDLSALSGKMNTVLSQQVMELLARSANEGFSSVFGVVGADSDSVFTVKTDIKIDNE